MKQETIQKIKNLYESEKTTIDYLIEHSTDDRLRADCKAIRKIALENQISVTKEEAATTAL